MDNSILTITQIFLGNDHYRCELTLDGLGRFTATIDDFTYYRTAELQAEIRWYLEEYPQDPDDHAASAALTRQKLQAEGEALFKMLFLANEDTRLIWERVQRQMSSVRVEIFTVADAVRNPLMMGPPWELLRNPAGGEPLAAAALAFVRVPTPAFAFPVPGSVEKGKLRILFVIAHPDELDEFPLRSVARRLLQGLTENARNRFEWEILAPASFSALAARLRRAQEEKQPFHVVHYDGKGLSINYAHVPTKGLFGWMKTKIVALLMGILSIIRANHQAYLLLDPNRGTTSRPLSGSLLGDLLNETGTPWLVLNACHAIRWEQPDALDTFLDDPYLQSHALIRVAHDVVAAGANGAVTISHFIPTDAAAQFAIDLYNALGAGCSLGEAVNRGRQRLYRRPRHEVGLGPLDLTDAWSVPVVCESLPLRLFPASRRFAPLLHDNLELPPSRVDDIIPARPANGVYGRDETLLVLMRALRQHHVVLLQGQVGAGKTQVAAELVRWGLQTGEFANHVIIWSDFSLNRSLDSLADDYRRAFAPIMDKLELSWPEHQKKARHIPWQFMLKIPVLWIWDHVDETHAVMPSWEEQHDIALFLRVAIKTKAQFLLLSHRDEKAWLRRLPQRISLPLLPTQECLTIIRDLTRRAGQEFTDPAAWRPVLDFVEGNPSALILLISSILKENIETAEEINEFVEHLESMREPDEDETAEEMDTDSDDATEIKNIIIAEGYDYPLSVLLAYQFVAANFTDLEQRRLSLLSLFKGFVDVDVLTWMSDTDDHEFLPSAIRDVTWEDWIALLDHAVEADLLTVHDEGYYNINPLRGILFTRLFLSADVEFKNAVEKSYLTTMEDLGNYYYDEYHAGRYEMLEVLPFEVANLLHAWQLARQQDLWFVVINVAEALLTLYQYQDEQNEWDAIVARLVKDFVEDKTDDVIPGNEDRIEIWGTVTTYRIALAIRNEEWELAERLQKLHIDWARRRAAGLLDRAATTLDSDAHEKIQDLALSINDFGALLQKQEKIACMQPYQVALELHERIANYRDAAIIAVQLAQICREQPALQEQIETWQQKALQLAAQESPEFHAQLQQWPE